MIGYTLDSRIFRVHFHHMRANAAPAPKTPLDSNVQSELPEDGDRDRGGPPDRARTRGANSFCLISAKKDDDESLRFPMFELGMAASRPWHGVRCTTSARLRTRLCFRSAWADGRYRV